MEARHLARPSRTERGGGVPASERVGESEGRSPSDEIVPLVGAG
jgi:hypothetical protein